MLDLNSHALIDNNKNSIRSVNEIILGPLLSSQGVKISQSEDAYLLIPWSVVRTHVKLAFYKEMGSSFDLRNSTSGGVSLRGRNRKFWRKAYYFPKSTL